MGRQDFWDCPACGHDNPHGGFLTVELTNGKTIKGDICNYCSNLIPESAITVYEDDDGIDDEPYIGEYAPENEASRR